MPEPKHKASKPKKAADSRRRRNRAQAEVSAALSAKTEAPRDLEAREAGAGPEDRHFPVVGVGASAGGLESFTRLLGSLPAHTGMAFVLIQHLAPQHESFLPEILARSTRLTVLQAADGMVVEADHVYVIPPNATLSILHGVLHLMARNPEPGRNLPVDFFFRSLAQDQGANAMGVVLSGTASDGALGLAEIRGQGGITFVEDPATARYDGMPRSALGSADFVLAPERIGEELARLSRHPDLLDAAHRMGGDGAEAREGEDFSNIYVLLRGATGADFTYYKQSTLKRRILRRMLLHKIDKLPEYVRRLQTDPGELRALFNDMLISVTSFFRDPEAFQALKTEVLPALMKGRSAENPVRVWVTGCATGEEAYSVAMSFQEVAGDLPSAAGIQVFATDLSEDGIEKARSGIYPESIKLDVSAERLRRFFVKTDAGYRISKGIRDLCVFARQNLLRDPPFSKLDLITCRNVMIYLGPVLQKRLLPIFHYALKPNGFLMLGTSETVGSTADLFTAVDKANKIYAKKTIHAEVPLDFEAYKESLRRLPGHAPGEVRDTGSQAELQREADRILLGRYAPAGAVVNEELEILQFRGQASRFLEPAAGSASFQLLRMAREGLVSDLRAAFQKAKSSDTPVRREGLRARLNGRAETVDLEVIPMRTRAAGKRLFLAVFETRPAPPARPSAKAPAAPEPAERHQVARLKRELSETRDTLQSTIEQLETGNEELRSANEEIQSSNEELQSTNEELETAKEELQSTNEELTTVNEELQNRNAELARANDDMTNLLASINMPVVMLDNGLCVRRFTPTAGNVLNLIPTDIGRPISDINPNIVVPDLDALIREVLSTLHSFTREVQDRQGGWYSMQIRPYRSGENRIEGVVLALFDIDAIKRGVDYSDAILDTLRQGVVVLNAEWVVERSNPMFSRIFGLDHAGLAGRPLLTLKDGFFNIPPLVDMLERVSRRGETAVNFELKHDFPGIGPKDLLINARSVFDREGKLTRLVMAVELKG